MLRRLIEGLFVLVALLAVAALVAARRWPEPTTGLYGRAAALTGSTGDLGPVDFVLLTRRARSNDALVCPERVCQHAAPDIVAPVFPVPPTELMTKLRIVVDSEPRSGLLDRFANEPQTSERFVQYSAVFYLPDVVDATVISAGSNSSTLAIYSRSVFGTGDLGVNRARLERWLAALKRIIPNS
jgi:uncharacterized protein (DUF1499 family)